MTDETLQIGQRQHHVNERFREFDFDFFEAKKKKKNTSFKKMRIKVKIKKKKFLKIIKKMQNVILSMHYCFFPSRGLITKVWPIVCFFLQT